MPIVYVQLSTAERDELLERARLERRRPKDQAALILVEGLRRDRELKSIDVPARRDATPR